ncbi:unnamed protein product, partial [marine sediment metagenome]
QIKWLNSYLLNLKEDLKEIFNRVNPYCSEFLIDYDEDLNMDESTVLAVIDYITDFTKYPLTFLDTNNRFTEAIEKKGVNPFIRSSGMLIGEVEMIGIDLRDKIELKEGDKIASLVSLSLTPLKIEKIVAINPDIDRIEIEGKAILFESGIYAKLPGDIEATLALAALDIAGAPAQVKKLVKEGDTVLILGATGKSGLICSYMAKKMVGKGGRVIGQARNEARAEFLRETEFCHEVIIADVLNPINVLRETLRVNGGNEVDIAINCLSIPNSE